MRKLIAALVVLLAPGVALAQAPVVLDFELCLNSSCNVGTAYSAQGITFNPSTQAIVTGPGSWGIVGTNGPQFLGFNGVNPGYGMTMTFATPQTSISMDVSRSTGSSAGDTFTATIFNGVTAVGTTTITFAAINTWTTVTLTAPQFDSIVWSGSGAGYHPYGVDNIRLAAPGAGIPALSLGGVAVLAVLLAALGLFALRRQL